jgi:putative spermidine/putrescine transport system substrate-binding protein
MRHNPAQSIGLVAGVMLLLTACGSSPAPTSSTSGPLTPAQTKGRTLTIAGWGGAWTDATKKFAEHFAQQYGVTIQYPSFDDPELTLQTQEQAGSVQMDVVDSASWISYKKNILAPFPDYLVNTIKQNVAPNCVSSVFIGCYGATADVIACNPAVMSKCPTNAKEFWDVKNFPGPRAMDGVVPDATLLFALLADGVPKTQLYPIDINKAITKLKQIKPNVQVWTTSGGQMQQVLVNKEVGVEYAWNGRVFATLQNQIPGLKVSWDDSAVSNPSQGGLAVAKGSPNADLAFTFLNWWVQQAQYQADWTSALTYPTPNKNVNALLSPAVLAAMPFAPNHTQPVLEDAEWTFEHQTEEEQAFQTFLTGA